MRVVGAGPAGLAAACRAAEAGARVLLLDEQPAPGGQIWRRRRCRAPIRPALAERLERSGAERLVGASVFDAQPGRLVAEWRGERLTLRAPRIVVATGARELFLPFPGWTLPGAFGAGAAQALLKQGASFAGRRVVVSGQRAAAAGGRRAAGACGRPRGDDRRASADGPPGGLRRRSLAPAGQAGRGAARARGGLARRLPPEHVGHGRSTATSGSNRSR